MDVQNKNEKRAALLSQRLAACKQALKGLSSDQKAQKRLVFRLLRAFAAFAVSFLLSGAPMLFGTFPMGLALLCAADEYLLFLFAGCFLGTLQGILNPVPFLAVYTLLLAWRLHMSYRFKEKDRGDPFKKGEPRSLRVAASLIGGLALGLYGCFAEQFSFHALFALIFYLTACGCLTYLLSGLFIRPALRGFFFKLGLVTLAFCLVFAANAYPLFGFSTSLALGTLFILLLARREHPVFCAFAGLALGLACGRDYAPVLALMAVVDCTFLKVNRKIAPWLSVLAGFAFAYYAIGSSALLYTLPDLVCGLILYTPLSAFLEKQNKTNATELHSDHTEEPSNTTALSSSVQTLSEKLSTLSKALRLPSKEDSLRICQGVIENRCQSCNAHCFSKDEALRQLSDTLFETGRLLYEQPPKALDENCTGYRLLCDDINNEYALYLEKLSRADKADCYALCFRDIARLLNDRDNTANEQSAENEAVKGLFAATLDRLKIGYESLSVTGTRRVVLKASGVNLSDISQGAFDLQEHFEKHCGMPLSLPELKYTDREQSLCFFRRPAFLATMGAVSEKKQGESYCGDTVYSFSFDNYQYFLLCDGMGSGREAALISRIACHFIEQMTCCGGTPETILKSVNDFLLGQSCECSTTIDLMRLDLYDGHCDFVKSGACPSLVLRAGNTFKVSSVSMPIGTARETNCEQISLRLKEGDVVIMASDGVAGDIEGSAWLPALLTGKLKDDPQGLSEDILALSKKEDKRPDDCSVMVVRVGRAPEPKRP